MRQLQQQPPAVTAPPAGGPPTTGGGASVSLLPTPRPIPASRLGLVVSAFVLDASLTWLAFCTAYFLRYVAKWVPFVDRNTLPVAFRDWIPFGVLFSLTVLAALVVSGLYRSRLGLELLDEVQVIVKATLVGVGLVVIVSSFLPNVVQYSHLVIVYAWLLLLIFLTLGKSLLHGALGRLHSSGWNTRRVVVAGTAPISKMVMQNLLGKRNRGYQLIGFVQENQVPARVDFGRFRCRGSVSDLQQVIAEWEVDEVIVALRAENHSEINEICTLCEQARVAVKMVPDLFELSLSRVRMDQIAGIPLIDVRHASLSRVARLTKRAMDIVVAGFFLVLSSPLLLLTALAIKLDSPGPVMANQQRIGKDAKPFTFHKFRSMYIDAAQKRAALEADLGSTNMMFKDRHDPRRTRVGRLIRKLSIDELPQLLNVLKGDMSLVGPRPPLPSEVDAYKEHQFKRLEVLGGMTGLWQVSGRSNIDDFDEVLMMDTYYIDNWSLALDLKILLRTPRAVLSRDGAY